MEARQLFWIYIPNVTYVLHAEGIIDQVKGNLS